jgi:hypothetical protein
LNNINQIIVIDQELKDIIIGKLLGDSSITKQGNITIEHSMKQREYVYHLYEKFKNIIKNEPKIYERLDKRYNKINTSIYIKTNPIFKNYENIFYKNILIENKIKRIKIVPLNIKELLTSKALAY